MLHRTQLGSFLLTVPFFLPAHTVVSHPRYSSFPSGCRTNRRTLERQSGQLTSARRSRKSHADRSQRPSWPNRTHRKDPPLRTDSSLPSSRGHCYCAAKARALSTGNTIEGGLMEIKTPYRIPYVSQMAARYRVLVTSISHLSGSSRASFLTGLFNLSAKERYFFATVKN